MKFYQLWILRRLVLFILFLMTGVNFHCGITPCASYYLQSKRNSSEGQNFLNDYLSLALNKSRELEEVIYSDILNNLRTLVRTQNSETESTSSENAKIEKTEYNTSNRTESLDHEYRANESSKNVNNVKTERIECNNGNRTGNLNHSYASVYDVFLSGEEERAGSKLTLRNYIPSVSGEYPKTSYLLGYSGNPFGSQKLIAGIAEMPEDKQNERVVIDPRKKRSVLHLYNMVLCSTGCNPIAYKGYGCYCGFLGSGFVVDGIDSCCKMHDSCYNSAGCPMFLEYFIPYFWKCYHRQPLCAIDYGYYGGPGSCSQRLCECDRQLALCLRRYPCPRTKALCTSSPWRLLQNILML